MEPDGGLARACLAVRPPGPGVCRICCGAVEGPLDSCWSCRRIEHGLRRELRVLTPISLAKRTTGLYAALRQYKGVANSIALRQQIRLAELIGAFWEHHSSCVAPQGADLVVVVPSSQVPGEAHPLAATLEMVPAFEGKVADALTQSTSLSVERNVADPGAYICDRAAVEEQSVLLMDDVYTTGAHMHSAVAAIEGAGASSVSLLAVVRFEDPDWPPADRLLRWAAAPEHRWRLESCVRCSDRPDH